MHEVSLVADLLAQAEEHANGQAIVAVRVRHASTIPEPMLRQAFQLLAQDGALAGATLEAETFDINLSCNCGFVGALGHHDLIAGSMAVCPTCSEVTTLPRTAELELMEVQVARETP